MASVTMTASFLASNMTKTPLVSRRGLIVAKATKEDNITCVDVKTNNAAREERSNGRRDLVFTAAAAAAVAALGVARMAVAEEDPKPGTGAAKKKYAAICVTMPTARICHK